MIGERGGRRCGELLLCQTSGRRSTSTSGSSMRQARWCWKALAISTWSANSRIRHMTRDALFGVPRLVLRACSVALLELLAAAAGTRIVAADAGIGIRDKCRL